MATTGLGQAARRRTREWELSEFVQDGSEVADAVMREERDRQRVQNMTRSQRIDRPARSGVAVRASKYGLPSDPVRQADIDRLLAGARAGDQAAVVELREKYKAWIA